MSGSIVDREDLEKDASNLNEKRPPSEVSYDLEGGDEALNLVGAQRTTDFTEEFNLKLRRKLVSDNSHPVTFSLFLFARIYSSRPYVLQSISLSFSTRLPLIMQGRQSFKV